MDPTTYPVPNTRELFDTLDFYPKYYTRWIQKWIARLNLTEGQDYTLYLDQGETTGRPKHYYLLTEDSMRLLAANHFHHPEVRALYQTLAA